MTDVSAMVTNWTAIVRTVVSSIRTNVDAVAPLVERSLFPGSPGERVRAIILAKADLLERKLHILQERDRAVAHERGDDAATTKAEDDAVTALRRRIIRTRAAVRSVFDEVDVARLGLTGETPEDPDALMQYAATASAALRAEPLPADDGDDDDERAVTVHLARLAAQVDRDLAVVRAALETGASEVREEQADVAARNRAEAELREAYIGIADGFAGDAVLAGRRDIADAVRPTARRRSGQPEPTDIVEPGDDGPAPTPTV